MLISLVTSLKGGILSHSLVGTSFRAKIKSRRLDPHEFMQYGDVVEDIQAGDRSRAEKGSFYGSLVGLPIHQIKQLPQVADVFREELDSHF